MRDYAMSSGFRAGEQPGRAPLRPGCSAEASDRQGPIRSFTSRPTRGPRLFLPAIERPSRHAERRVSSYRNMAYRANVDAAKHLVADIMPRIHGQRPDVRLYIVGMDPTPAVRRLSDGEVWVTGRVEDVRPYSSSSSRRGTPADGAWSPEQGVGGNGMGVPVVASRGRRWDRRRSRATC